MPTYQYACTSCGERLEAVQKFTDEPLTVCPSCSGALRKVFSAVGVVFKGSGFYKTDSRATSGSSAAKPDAGKSGADKTAGKKDAATPSGSDSGSGPSSSGGSGAATPAGGSGSGGTGGGTSAGSSAGDRVA